MSAKFHPNNVSLHVRKIKRLTALKIASLKQPGRFADGNGLELQIGKTGSKSWLLRYTLNGHEHRMGLGSLKDFNLAEARDRARQARQLLADGKDPLSLKRAAKLESMRMLTFRECAEAFMSVKLSGFRNAKHQSQWRSTLEIAYKAFGSVPVSDITTAMVLQLLRPLWDSVPSTASRLRGRIERVLGWATAAGYRVGDNPARWRGHLQDMFPSKETVRAASLSVEIDRRVGIITETNSATNHNFPQLKIILSTKPGEEKMGPYIVFRDQGQWKIKSDSVHYGPYPTQRDAIRAAVNAVHEAGLKGHNGQVVLQDKLSIEWAYGKDPYPPQSSDYL